jgi:hypothetical protein
MDYRAAGAAAYLGLGRLAFQPRIPERVAPAAARERE